MPAATSSAAVAPNGGPKTETSPPSEVNNFPPPKTDKPRPHMCGTCQRAFARLEHLKRHERSHTKEKPFECPECARCFARRDLLLRHQQKLHMTTTPSSRPRNRRESAASTTAGPPNRVRKGSVAGGAGGANMRPRANTISHVDAVRVQMMAAANIAQPRNGPSQGHSRHPSLLGFGMQEEFQYGGMSNSMSLRGVHHGIPKLDTIGFNNIDFGGGLRTAPIGGSYDADIDFEGLLFGPGSTINPNALHYSDSPQAMAIDTLPPYHQGYPEMTPNQSLEEDFNWMNGFEHQMSFNENAIDGSSPSAISTTSQSGISEVMLDGSSNQASSSASMWQQTMMPPPPLTQNSYTVDLGQPGFTDLMNGPMSPHSLPSS